jgi:hypothetical protein
MTKTELVEALEDGHAEMVEMLEDLPEASMLEPGVIGNWSIKDILYHLSMWEGQLVTLLFQVSRGMENPTTLHFGEETVEEINQRWFSAGQRRPLDLVWQDWVSVRKQTLRRVSDIPETDLTNPNKFGWLKGEPLLQWIADDTIEHEEEHGDAIREWLDRRDAIGSDGNNEFYTPG